MNIKPILQTKLYGLNLIFNEIVNLSNSNKLPNKILFSGSKGSGKSTLAYHLINYIFSIYENLPFNIKLNEISVQNNSFKLIKNGSHPNFHLIDLIEDKKNNPKKSYFELTYASLIKKDESIKEKGELEKIILCDVQKQIQPNIEKVFTDLINNSGFKGVSFKKIDFEKLYNSRFN